jgi:hypothetical protein
MEKTIKISSKPMVYWNWRVDELLEMYDRIIFEVMSKNDDMTEEVFGDDFNEFFRKINRKEIKICEGCTEFIRMFKEKYTIIRHQEKFIPFEPNRLKMIYKILENKKNMGLIRNIEIKEVTKDSDTGDKINLYHVIVEKEKLIRL